MRTVTIYFLKIALPLAVIWLAFKISSGQGPNPEHRNPNPALEIVSPDAPHQPTGNFHN